MIEQELYTLIVEINGVEMIELEESELYFISYDNYAGRRVRSPLLPYAEAESNFVRRIEEADYDR